MSSHITWFGHAQNGVWTKIAVDIANSCGAHPYLADIRAERQPKTMRWMPFSRAREVQLHHLHCVQYVEDHVFHPPLPFRFELTIHHGYHLRPSHGSTRFTAAHFRDKMYRKQFIEDQGDRLLVWSIAALAVAINAGTHPYLEQIRAPHSLVHYHNTDLIFANVNRAILYRTQYLKDKNAKARPYLQQVRRYEREGYKSEYCDWEWFPVREARVKRWKMYAEQFREDRAPPRVENWGFVNETGPHRVHEVRLKLELDKQIENILQVAYQQDTQSDDDDDWIGEPAVLDRGNIIYSSKRRDWQPCCNVGCVNLVRGREECEECLPSSSSK